MLSSLTTKSFVSDLFYYQGLDSIQETKNKAQFIWKALPFVLLPRESNGRNVLRNIQRQTRRIRGTADRPVQKREMLQVSGLTGQELQNAEENCIISTKDPKLDFKPLR